MLWYNLKVDRNRKLKDLQSRLLGLELDLDLIEQDIENIDADINYLNLVEEETSYNIKILKKEKIIADLKTYRQSCQKLSHVRQKTEELIRKKNSLQIKLNKKINLKNHYDKEWETLLKEMEEERVILIFKKRKNETGND